MVHLDQHKYKQRWISEKNELIFFVLEITKNYTSSVFVEKQVSVPRSTLQYLKYSVSVPGPCFSEMQFHLNKIESHALAKICLLSVT